MNESNDPRRTFDADPFLDEIIAQQGNGPIADAGSSAPTHGSPQLH